MTSRLKGRLTGRVHPAGTQASSHPAVPRPTGVSAKPHLTYEKSEIRVG